jgi:hypothetical protein
LRAHHGRGWSSRALGLKAQGPSRDKSADEDEPRRILSLGECRALRLHVPANWTSKPTEAPAATATPGNRASSENNRQKSRDHADISPAAHVPPSSKSVDPTPGNDRAPIVGAVFPSVNAVLDIQESLELPAGTGPPPVRRIAADIRVATSNKNEASAELGDPDFITRPDFSTSMVRSRFG